MAKITPIHKKGSIHSIENYRPVAGLCSGSKIFERLILKRIAALELQHDVYVFGNERLNKLFKLN